jgi:hypothetical protein
MLIDKSTKLKQVGENMMTALSASLIIGNFEIFEKIFNLVGIEHFEECKVYDYSS